MPQMPVPIILGDKINENIDYQDAVPVNLIAIQRQILGAEGYLTSHEGLDFFRNGVGADRGALYNERWNRSFRASGNSLIELFPDETMTTIGAIDGSEEVCFAYSFQSIVIVANGRAYRYDGAVFSEITDPDLGSPISVTWIDGYYFFTDGEYIYHTDIGDETSIDPLKYATAEISPDKTMAVSRTQDDLVIVFGRYTIEYFVNQANTNFAFSRINQKAINSGIIGANTWCEMDGTMFILGGRREESPSVHIISAGKTIDISTRYISKILSKYTAAELASASLEGRIVDRSQLIYVYLPDYVFIYNHTIAKDNGPQYAWSELKSGSGKWRAKNGIFDPLLNTWIYGDSEGAIIWKLNKGRSSQNGQPSMFEFSTPLLPIESASIDSVELDTVSGFQANDARMFISTTRDGANYSTEWSREVAGSLDYDLRVIFRRLGYVRKKIGLKFRGLTTEKITIGGAVINYD